MFDKIKKWYNNGIWKIEMVKNAIKKGIIKKEDFEKITGEKYV